MPEASVTYISDIDTTTYPITTASDAGETWEWLQDIRVALENSLGNISAAVTANATDLNYCDITTLGTAENSKFISVDGSGNCDCSAVTFTDGGAHTTIDINGGTIDGVTIGGASAGAVSATTMDASGNATVGGTIAVTGAQTLTGATTLGTSLALPTGATVTAILDEDAMGSDSATSLATQQSIKAYVDNATSGALTTQTVVLNHKIPDVSTADTLLIPVPVTGTVARVDTVLGGAITVADATVTLKDSADNAMASLTIAYSGSAAGDVDTDTTISNASVTAGDYLKLATDGGSTDAQELFVAISITV